MNTEETGIKENTEITEKTDKAERSEKPSIRERITQGIEENLRERKEMNEGVSLRGITAREIVRAANHFPVIGDLRRNGELQNLKSDHEPKWRCPEGLLHTEIRMEHFKMELFEREDVQEERQYRHVILQLHGGGYYGRMHNVYRDTAVMYMEVSDGYDILTPDYRVAPEDPYPAALDDAVAAYTWLLEQGYTAERIIVAGDSAGGGLSLALTLYLKDHGMPMPGGIITMSAWTDLTKSGDSYQENFDRDPIFGGSKHTLVYKEGYYGDHDPMDPYISPVGGDYRGFPPMLMQVGSLEMLLDDTLSVSERARYAGVHIKTHVYTGMFHIFQMGFKLYPEAVDAWKEVGHFLRVIRAR